MAERKISSRKSLIFSIFADIFIGLVTWWGETARKAGRS
jgi:hypothetical protein